MRVPLAFLLLLSPGAVAFAEEPPPPPPAPAAQQEPSAADYCANFADRAAEARIAWQTGNLKQLQDEVAKKIAELEAKQKDLQQWIDKREAILKQAGKELVDIYAKMDPEAAAAQLGKLDTGTAVAVLRQLSPRAASAIMAAIPAERASVLAKAIATVTLEPPPPAPAGGAGKGT